MTTRTWACAVLLAALLTVVAPCAQPSPAGPTPHPEAQAAIERLVEAIAASDGRGPNDEIPSMAEQLRNRMSGDEDSLLLQLVLYLATHPGNEQAMGTALLIDYYRFSDEEKVAALAPHVAADDDELRDAVLETLSTVHGPPEVRESVERLQAIEQFLMGPEAASTAEVERSLRSLDIVSRDDAWWVRLYAARAVRTRPDLASPGIVDRLRDDLDPRVRDLATW